jgi:hypothetical protein
MSEKPLAIEGSMVPEYFAPAASDRTLMVQIICVVLVIEATHCDGMVAVLAAA